MTGHDIRHPEVITFAADIVYHLAAISSVGACQSDPTECLDVNVMGTARIIEYAKSCAARVVFASSGSVYGECYEPAEYTTPRNPLSWYGLSKLLGEKLLESSEIEYAAVRLGNVVGGDAYQGRIVPALLRCAETGEPFIMRGDSVRAYVSLYDAVTALMCGESKNVGYVTASNLNVVKAVEDVTGKSIKVIERPRNPWEPDQTDFWDSRPGLIHPLIEGFVKCKV